MTGGVASKLFTFNIVYKCSLLLCISEVAGDLLQSHVKNITDINTVWKYIFGSYCVLNKSFKCDEFSVLHYVQLVVLGFLLYCKMYKQPANEL
jgi:hypothetical protein